MKLSSGFGTTLDLSGGSSSDRARIAQWTCRESNLDQCFTLRQF